MSNDECAGKAPGEVIFVLGGTRSGKSAIAERLASVSGDDVVYLATCVPGDDELLDRVARHRARRPASWRTVEEPRDPASALVALDSAPSTCLMDCLSFWIFNLMDAGRSDDEIGKAVAVLLDHARSTSLRLVIVSNEIGQALIPPDPVTRHYQDLLGRANQQVAAGADEVHLAVAGIPLRIK